MPDATPESSKAVQPVVDQWQARIMQPSFILLYLAVVFAALIALLDERGVASTPNA